MSEYGAIIKTDWADLVRARFSKPRKTDLFSDHVDELSTRVGRGLVRQLYDQGQEGGQARLRASGLGSCARSLAFKLTETPASGREIDGRTRIVFAMGDIVEQLVVTSLSEALEDIPEVPGASPYSLSHFSLDHYGDDQKRVRCDVGEYSISGHPDGFITYRGDARAVLEVKSTSSFGFQRASKALRNGEEPWTPEEGYWWQIQAYMHATEISVGVVIMVSKDSGAVLSFAVGSHPDFEDMAIHHLDLVSIGYDAADRPGGGDPLAVPRLLPCGTELAPVVDLHKRNGTPNKKHGTLPWNCRYCSHFRPCWGPEGLTETVGFDYRGAPSLALYVGREDLK